ncbi:RNA methyltransferase, partial [Polaribacter sp.]|nr:RNA methyltransferase [Polaribacter sp.]
MALSKNQLKLITSLSQKKYRTKHQLFIAEGVKVVEEILNSSFVLHHLFYTNDYDAKTILNKTLISNDDLKKISKLKSPNKILALFKIPVEQTITDKGLLVALDDINDPGNLGTIIRLCDWFGVKQLICSKNTVDAYNQKVVQATMGSLTRIDIIYTDLQPFLST